MIFTETREGRRFVGEVPPGELVIAGLRLLAENYRIASGWIEGSGYLRNPRICRVQADGSLADAESLTGTWLVGAMHVVISEMAGATHLIARVMLGDATGAAVSGLLLEAESGSLELLAHSFDDITLRRYEDPKAGLARWLAVAVNVVTTDPEGVRSGRVAMEAMPSRLLEETEMPQLRVGDALEHPRLGICIVTTVVDQDRVSIQMGSGKIAQLHLGLLTLNRSGVRQGRTVYSVQVRRRNG